MAYSAALTASTTLDALLLISLLSSLIHTKPPPIVTEIDNSIEMVMSPMTDRSSAALAKETTTTATSKF